MNLTVQNLTQSAHLAVLKKVDPVKKKTLHTIYKQHTIMKNFEGNYNRQHYSLVKLT